MKWLCVHFCSFSLSQVTGFGVSGLVRDSRGVGVEGAVVTVDGLNVTVTDKEGGYVLTSLSNKRYTIAAAKENARFSTLEVRGVFVYAFVCGCALPRKLRGDAACPRDCYCLLVPAGAMGTRMQRRANLMIV